MIRNNKKKKIKKTKSVQKNIPRNNNGSDRGQIGNKLWLAGLLESTHNNSPTAQDKIELLNPRCKQK